LSRAVRSATIRLESTWGGTRPGSTAARIDKGAGRKMKDYKEVVRGRIVARDGSTPVKGARVEVYDKDMLVNDHLGQATTDGEGRFRVGFLWSDFKDGVFEDRPDIFLEVHNPATGKKTRSPVFAELSGEMDGDDGEEVMDLGDVPVD
jgi:hypothetical protein